MGLSPRRRRHKPRHARPRASPWRRRCTFCLENCLRLLASQADVLLLQQHESWLSKVATLALLGLHLKRLSSHSRSYQQL